MKLKVLDLFSGIGGFSLGLERTGQFETLAFCESNESCRKVIRKNWKGVPIFDDVKDLTSDNLNFKVDVITGGFPCQDISLAGKGLGIKGPASSLWFEFERLINLVRPKYVIVENTPALRIRGLEEILYGLNEIGYDAEWHCVPASALGAFQSRDRIWIVAYSKGYACWPGFCKTQKEFNGSLSTNCDCTISIGGYMAELINTAIQKETSDDRKGESFGDYNGLSDQWSSEPIMDRVVNGVPGRVDRFKQLGNAIVPQIATLIGYAITEFEKGRGVAYAKITGDMRLPC